MTTGYIFLRTLVFVSIAFLLFGWKQRTVEGHRAATIGWVLFGFYWLLTIPHFLDNGEPVNAAYCALGFPLFLFLARQEHLSILWSRFPGEAHPDVRDPPQLGFMAGGVAISALAYFLIDTIPEVAAFFVWTTAEGTAVFLTLMGYEASTGAVRYDEIVRVPVYHGDQGGISIVLACTAIQSIVIFLAAILVTRLKENPMSTLPLGPLGRLLGFPAGAVAISRKWKGFLLTVPIILFLNIVRTAAVIYLVYEGHFEFDFAHNTLSRWGSMLVLIVLSYYLFDILPELYDTLAGIPGLIRRRPPLTSARAFVRL